MKKISIYYFANMPGQFSQIIPIYNRLGGYFITAYPFFETWFRMNLKFGPGSTKFIYKREKIYRKIKGILISQSATNLFPPSPNYIRIYAGHGVSDKQYETPDRRLKAESFDYFFLTGPKDLYRLESAIDNIEELHKKTIPIGMIRSDNIIKGVYNPDEVRLKYRIKGDKKTVLYAPTYYRDGGTLKRFFRKIIEELKDDFNLLIRPHYYDRDLFKSHISYIKNEKLENVRYIHDFKVDITELFSIADVLIGDRSSVDYDFTFTGKPIIRIEGSYKNYVKPPPKFDINNYCIHYNPEKNSLKELVYKALSDNIYREKIVELRENCFYFNDGHALDRACSTLIELKKEMEIKNAR